MTPRELQAEIQRLRKIVRVAATKARAQATAAKAQAVVVDKLTAALLHVELLAKKARQ